MRVPDPFYTSKEWRKLRQRVLHRDGHKCVGCGVSVQGKGMSRVDHILTRRERPDLAMEINNLRSLCPGCDNRRHRDKGSVKHCGGRVIPMLGTPLPAIEHSEQIGPRPNNLKLLASTLLQRNKE